MKKLVLISSLALSFLSANNAGAEGNSLGAELKNYFKGNQETAINALTNDGQLSSVDGKQKANVKIVCDATKSGEFLNISYSNVSDGNIDIKVSLDENVDGTKDRTWYFNGVSGVCSNGVAKCKTEYRRVGGSIFNPKFEKDTWASCEFYEYAFNGDFSLVKSTQEKVNGCYCINESCGNVAANDRNKILQTIAGATYSLLASKTKLVLSKASIVGGALSYQGQDYSACDTYGKSVSVDSSSDLESVGKNLAQNESKNENSAYSVFYKGTDNKSYVEDKAFENKLSKDTIDIGKSTKATQSSNIDFSYVDTINQKGVAGSIQNTPQVDAKFCEVRVPKQDTSAFSDGTNRANSTTDTTIYQNEIRECTNNWNTCPVAANEKLKHECGKINDMGEALAYLSTVEEMSKDMVCSK